MKNILFDLRETLEETVSPGNDDLKIQEQIKEEIDFWNSRVETDPGAEQQLAKYWNYVNVKNWDPVETPWSAAFISYVLRNSGFPKTSAHYQYIEQIKNSPVSPYRLFDIGKQKEVFLNVGDVLVKPRSGSDYATHGDIVYKIENGKAFLVGGNLSNTVKISRLVDVDSRGKVMSNLNPYVILIKKKGRPALILAPVILGIVGITLLLRNRS